MTIMKGFENGGEFWSKKFNDEVTTGIRKRARQAEQDGQKKFENRLKKSSSLKKREIAEKMK